MIGLDTNVLVRYLTQDDPAQARQAGELIESFTADHPGFVSLVALVELTWVLQSCYQVKRQNLVKLLKLLLGTKELIIQDAAWVWRALRRFDTTTADFADCLIEHCGRAVGCQSTVTFDRQAIKAAGMIPVAQAKIGKVKGKL